MGMIKVSRRKDIAHSFNNGLSRQKILVGEYSQAVFETCAMQPGAVWAPARYKVEDRNQIFLFTSGSGYITTPRRAFNITEVSVFVPEFDTEIFEIHASADSPGNLEFLNIKTLMSGYDITCMREARMSLPRFRGLSQGWTYDEEFKGPGTTSIMLLEHRNLGRISMGATLGCGPSYVGQHIHNELEQWYHPLPGASFTYTANGEEIRLEAGDLSYTPHGFHHGSKAAEGEKFNYIWFELCENGYPGEIK